MLRSTIRSSLMFRRAAPAQIRAYSEGATGAPRNDGGDSFTKREKAQEDYYVKQHEAEKIAALKAQLKKHQEELDGLKSQIDSLEK